MFIKYTYLRYLANHSKARPEDPQSATAQAIIPKVSMKFWKGAERTLFEFVRRGGQLYIVGGHMLRDRDS